MKHIFFHHVTSVCEKVLCKVIFTDMKLTSYHSLSRTLSFTVIYSKGGARAEEFPALTAQAPPSYIQFLTC